MKQKKNNSNAKPIIRFCQKIYLFIIFDLFVKLLLWKKAVLKSDKAKISIISSPMLVSVIIPVYNKILYLNSSFDSVQSQTLRKIEIICIDDYSIDQSSEFIKKRMKSDNRIKLIQNYYNQGTCLVRINGVLISTGDYIFSYDPDDLLTPTAIEFNYKLAFELNADIIDYRIKAKSPAKIKHNYCPCRHNYSSNTGILERLKTYSINWNLCKKLIRRSIYLKAIDLIFPFVENKRIIAAEDLLHCGAIFFFVNKFICSKHLTYIYFLDMPESSGSGKNQPIEQNELQLYYIRSIISYFLSNKENVMSCTPQKLFALNKTALDLYQKVSNVTKTKSNLSCMNNYNGFHSEIYDEKGFCVITYKNH